MIYYGELRSICLLTWLVWFCTCLSIAMPAVAATSTEVEQAVRESDRLLLEQQQRDALRQKQIDERIRKPSGETLTLPALEDHFPKAGCHQISKIHLDGATILSVSVITGLVAPFEGKCIGLEEINQLLQAVTNYYIQHGYSTTRAYIPEQDMSGGELHILILEGLVESIRSEGKGVSIVNAFPGLIGKPFNLREFEQGIDQINRLQSNSASIDIQPGTKPGTSIILVKNKPMRPWTLNMALDNTGNDATGYYQTSASLGYDNLLGLDDYLNFSARINPDADMSHKLSRSLSATYSIPLGRWTLTGSASDYNYVSIVHGAAMDFQTSGVSRSINLRMDRMMFRNQNSKWQLSAALTRKQSDNFINHERIQASSRVLAVVDFGSNLTQVALGGLWTLDVGLSFGLDAFGAVVDADNIPGNAPRAQFTKLTYGAAFQRPFKLWDTSFSWQSSLSGQFSNDVLYGTEQFLIGSPYSVRGFRKHALSGDNGLYLRNELGLPLPMKKLFGESAPNGQIKPYIGLDVGHILEHYGSPSGTLSGFTAGINVASGPWSMQASYSRAITDPDSRLGIDHYGYVRLSLDW